MGKYSKPADLKSALRFKKYLLYLSGNEILIQKMAVLKISLAKRKCIENIAI